MRFNSPDGAGVVAQRFSGPFLVIVAGGALLLLSWLTLGSWAESHQLHRLGWVLLICGVLWGVAIGFSLGTLRIVTAATLVFILFLLSSVGDQSRDRIEAAEYRALQGQLAVELNVLVGERTEAAELRSRVLESIDQLETGLTAHIDSMDQVTGIGDAEHERRFEAADLRAYCDHSSLLLVQTGHHLEVALVEVFDVLQLSDDEQEGHKLQSAPPDAVPTVPPTCKGSLEELSHVEQDLVYLRGNVESLNELLPANTDVQRADVLGTAAADAVVSVSLRTRTEVGEAVEAAALVRASTAALIGLLDDFQSAAATAREAEIVNIHDSGSGDVVAQEKTAAAELPELSIVEGGIEECHATSADPIASASFGLVRSVSGRCVAGCDTSGPTCLPRTAKRNVLRAFQGQLQALTQENEIAEDSGVLQDRLKEVSDQLSSINDPVPVHGLMRDGSDVVIGDALATVINDDTPVRVGGWAWLVILGAIVFGYRQLEIINDGRQPGPVEVRARRPTDKAADGDSTGGTDDGSHFEISASNATVVELMRTYLGAAQLAEPSPVPGGEAVRNVAEQSDSSGPDRGIVGAVLRVLHSTVFPKRGVELVVHLAPPSDGTEKPNTYGLLLTALVARSGALLFSRPFYGKSVDDVARQASHYSAVQLLGDGWTTPPWKRWEPGDGNALDCYQKVVLADHDPVKDMDLNERIDLLKRSVSLSPSTGVTRVRLANELSMRGHARDYAEAIQFLLPTVRDYPSFLTARYRYAVTLSTVSTLLSELLLDNDGVARTVLPAVLDPRWPAADPGSYRSGHASACGLLDVDALWTCSGGQHEANQAALNPLRICLLQIAEDELVEISRMLRAPGRRAWRQDERQYWLTLARSRGPRKSMEQAVALALAHVRRRLASIEKAPCAAANVYLEQDKNAYKAVQEGRSSAIVFYNAACYATQCGQDLSGGQSQGQNPSDDQSHSPFGTTEPACFQNAARYLREARMLNEGHTLTLEWMKQDPDLKPLRDYGTIWNQLEQDLQLLENATKPT